MKVKLVAAFFASSSLSVALASQLVYDGFDYSADGNPVLGTAATGNKGRGIWTSQGNGTTEVRIASGSLSYPGFVSSVGNSVKLDNNNGAATGADGSRLFLGTVSSQTVYYSFLVSVPAYSSTTTPAAYFAGLDNSPASTYLTAAGLWVRPDAVATSAVDLGISNSGSTHRVYSSTAYAVDQTLLVVGSFTQNDVATLDVFANGTSVPASAPAVHSAVTSGVESSDVTSITNFYLRGNVSEPQGIQVDEVRVGTTWADVVPEPAAAAIVFGLALPSLFERRRK